MRLIMAYGHGRDNGKMRRQSIAWKDNNTISRNCRQYYISKDIEKKNKPIKHSYNNVEDRQKGFDWFNNGLSLEEAPEEMQNNASFIVGYNRAYRAKIINDNLYDLGREYYERGVSLEDIPERYKDDEYFINGYNSKNKIR